MDPVQIVNGTIAVAALAASQWSWIRVQQTTRPAVVVVHVAHTALLLLFAITYLAAGLFGALQDDVTAILRPSFGPLLVTYSLKAVMASRRVVKAVDL
jgi:hypothetical protein